MSQDFIINIEKLFRFSGMIDSLRDSTKSLLDSENVDTDTKTVVNKRYKDLINEVKSTISEELHSEFTQFALADSEEMSLSTLYFLASQMSQYLELLHQTPEFMLSKQMRDANVVQISEAIESKFGKSEVVQFGFNN